MSEPIITLTLDIDSKFMERCGSGSLAGALVAKYGSEALAGPRVVVLRFQQTSYRWRERNGGPDTWIMPEFATWCLVEDILHLSQNYTLRIEEAVGDSRP